METSLDAQLKAFERVALRLGRAINERPLSKRLQYRFIRGLAYNWMRPFMSRRTYVDNIDWLISPPSDRGVLFACNHRSFFDSYLFLFSLYSSGAAWPRKLYFPVRSDFFYDQPLGVLVNLAMGGGCMYPPIYRDREKRSLNDDALQRIVEVLKEPNSLVGLHPEGTRTKGDPYTLLRAQPGIGNIVLHAKPLVVPVFVNGVGNDFLGALRTSFQEGAKRNSPIIVSFGQPVDYQEFLESKPRAALYKKCADKINHAISECGQRERELLAAITQGEIGDDDPHWHWHSRS